MYSKFTATGFLRCTAIGVYGAQNGSASAKSDKQCFMLVCTKRRALNSIVRPTARRILIALTTWQPVTRNAVISSARILPAPGDGACAVTKGKQKYDTREHQRYITNTLWRTGSLVLSWFSCSDAQLQLHTCTCYASISGWCSAMPRTRYRMIRRAIRAQQRRTG